MRKTTVIEHFRGTVATATALNISKSTVSLWGDVIPWKYALLISAATAGSLSFNWKDYPELSPVFKPQPGVSKNG
ncbi:Cro/CI family transcriptional regulator [Pantoea agglomerans]|uniref:Cro/CI family transcriptional regulator n=1 Tax=Enterobacter agglomerans TaxID=549 RepID=UPI00384D1AD7